VKIDYQVGTMIELPRACAEGAGEIAETAEFFSFGTNDLTQTTLRHLARRCRLVPRLLSPRKGILAVDPFVSLDQEGVGELVKIAVERGRKTRPDIKLGICGEHGGDPASIAFCESVGLDYVSCSPFRVPIARLAAAQAALRLPEPGQSTREKTARTGDGLGRRGDQGPFRQRRTGRLAGDKSKRGRAVFPRGRAWRGASRAAFLINRQVTLITR
jgi:hypothetical protein